MSDREWRSSRFPGPPEVYWLPAIPSVSRVKSYDLGVLAFPQVVPGEPVVVSASSYVAYRTCPEQAVARLRGHYPRDTRLSFRGGLAHRVFARHLNEGNIDEADFESVCREEIGQALNPSMGRVGLKPSELRGVISEIGELYQRFKRFPNAGFNAAEISIRSEQAGDVTLKGTIDAVFVDDGSIRLVDWKTGQLGAADHQLIFYAALWALERGSLPARVEAVSVATGERLERTPTLDDATSCLELVADFVSRARESFVDGGPLARVAGPWCRYCPVVDSCDEGAAAVRAVG